jgi:hypothetical protein
MALLLVGKKVLPRFVREWLYFGLNYLIPFNEHDRHKIWSTSDPLENVTVPSNERVFVPGLWVVELFPPSEFASLEEIIESNSWDRRRRYIFGREGNREMMERSRSGEGWTWWPLAEIARGTISGLQMRVENGFRLSSTRLS